MKAIIPFMLFALSSVSADTIFEYHEEFRFLLNHTETLGDIPAAIDQQTATLTSEVEVFAAADVKAASDLLHTSVSMLLQQHAAMVDVYSHTKYFNEDYILPSIELLFKNSISTQKKARKYLKLVQHHQLLIQITKLIDVAANVETKLRKHMSVDQLKAMGALSTDQ